MNVKVRAVGLLKTFLGREELKLSLPAGSTIDTVVARLAEIGDERLAPYVVIPERSNAHLSLRAFVNGRDYTTLGGRQAALQEGDEILVFVPVAGG